MEAIIKVRSKFKKEDYRKYLTLATFKGKKTTLPALVLIPLLLSILIPFALSKIGDSPRDIFNLKGVLFLYLPFLLISFGVVFLRLAMTYAKMKLVDTSNVFDTYNNFSFFEDEVYVENEAVEGKRSIKYKDFHKVLESRDYFILYFSENIVSIIRKEDLDMEQDLASFLGEKLDKRYRTI